MTFVPGHQLSAALYHDHVVPLMQRAVPDVPYTAVLIGSGSDVLGLDTERSMDHDWGPRLNLFLREGDLAAHRLPILDAIDAALPDTVLGIQVEIRGATDLPGDEERRAHSAGTPRNHGVSVNALEAYLADHYGIDPVAVWDVADWLAMPQQALLELTVGPCFHDSIGTLTRFRERIAWYPENVWRYLLSARWKRIAQLEAFVGRTGELGDDIGSQIITLRLIEDAMHLAFLQERRYAPYSKWLGTAFRRLAVADALIPALERARFAASWQEREPHLLDAIETLARRQNELKLADVVPVERQSFFDRPFQVIFAERFSRALDAAITDPAIRALPPHLGSIDSISDSTDARGHRGLRAALRDWFRTESTGKAALP